MEAALLEMLEVREMRARRQRELLAHYRRPLVSFTMNIAGPVKDSGPIRRGFEMGLEDLRRLLRAEQAAVLHREVKGGHTGWEALLAVDAPARRLKDLTTQLEEYTPLGRLWDMDVLSPSGEKLERAVPRRCLICGAPAHACARSRAHTLSALQEKTGEILRQAIDEADCRLAAQLAQQALLYETGVTPKPGLVDRANRGSHRDMDFFTFQRSAAALYPFFQECARIGRQTRTLPPARTLEKLRFPGKMAEGRMRAATGGVNTHKGAIFSMGILCGALGRMERADWHEPRAVLALCGEMAAGLLEEFQRPGDTVGHALYRDHGITGVRGEAAAGFPAVQALGLPRLEEGLARGKSLNDAACGALLALIAQTQDTNLIHRGGLERQQAVAAELSALLAADPFPSRAVLRQLDRRFMHEALSPGGCADLLGITLMLHFLKTAGTAQAEDA